MDLTLALFDRLGAVVWEVDSTDFRLVAINDRVEGMLGHRKSRWLDPPASFFDLAHGGDRPRVREAFTRAVERWDPAAERWDQIEFRLAGEFRLAAGSAGVRWVRCAFRAIADGRLIGTMVDVTDWHELLLVADR